MTKQIQAIIDEIERQSEPSKMSKEKAVEFLENIKEELNSRIECLKEEIENENNS